METHRKGDLTEAIVVTELTRRQIPVSRPIGDNERYDLVADAGGALLRLQVKTGWVTEGTIRFHGKSQHTNAQGNVYENYDGDVDYFVVYVHELETMYLIPESGFETDMRLRVEEPDQRDRTINWAENYEFDRRWPPEGPDRERAIDRRQIFQRFSEYDIPIYLPLEDESIVDALAESSDGDLYRLTVHSGWVVDGRIRFDPAREAQGEAGCRTPDFAVVYCSDLDQVYLIDHDEFESTITLRVDEPDKSDPRINWAEDFELASKWPP